MLSAFKALAGKTNLVKSQIEEKVKTKLQKGIDKFNTDYRLFTQLIDIESVIALPELRQLLLNLRAKETELADRLSSHEVLRPFVEVIGDHLAEFTSTEFKKGLKSNPSVQSLKKFAIHLVHIENYAELSQLIMRAQSISTLPALEQGQLYSELQGNQRITAILEENAKLDIEKEKQTLEHELSEIHSQLKLKPAESKKIIAVYHELMDKFLPEFNQLRIEIVKQLPALVAMELERIQRVCPHLALVQQDPTVPLTMQYEATQETTSNSATLIATPEKAKPSASRAKK